MPDINDVNGNPAIETDEPLSIQAANEWAIEVRGQADPRKAAIERLKCAAAQRRERKPINPLESLKSDPSYKVGTFNAEAGAFNVESSNGKKLLGQSLSNGNVRDGQKVRSFFAPNGQLVIDVKPKGRDITIPKPIEKPSKKKIEENIKILFYVNSEISPFVGYDELTVERLWKELWIGGTWPIKKVYTVPSGYRLADAFIVNTGEKEEDYIIMGRLFPLKKIHRWYSQLNVLSLNVSLESPAAIFFTIEKGVVDSQEFEQDLCPPYFWRYCGGGFFYSGGSQIGVNTIDNFAGHIRELWPRSYNWYNGWQSNDFAYTGQYVPSGNRTSFLNIGLHRVGMASYGSLGKFHVIKPANNYIPILSDLSKNGVLIWHSVDNVYQPPELLFATDICSNSYYRTKTIKNNNINTFYSFYTPLSKTIGSSDPGKLGFVGEVCVTPTKDFAINYQASNGGSDAYAATISNGFLYEPLIVNNQGDKTLAIKQFSTKAYQAVQKNFLLCLTDTGESNLFTKILGIPELNNFDSLGTQFIVSPTINLNSPPTLNGALYLSYFNPLASAWQSELNYKLNLYIYNGSAYSLASIQSEKNKEILYLKDFLLSFARFTGLSVFPTADVRTKLSSFFDLCTYLKPLASFIENSIYIPYGFIDKNDFFYGTQALSYSEPEKTRVLPKTDKATMKIVELVLNEIEGDITVEPNVKALPIYTVTPQNTGSLTMALASANYWYKTKSKGEAMPIYTPTPAPTPAPNSGDG